jgi:hypothetical protein
MHYFKKKGKPQLDASGNLILSKNAQLVTTTSSSAGPASLDKVNYVMLRGRGFMGKVRASTIALNWIWSK